MAKRRSIVAAETKMRDRLEAVTAKLEALEAEIAQATIERRLLEEVVADLERAHPDDDDPALPAADGGEA